MPTAGTFKPSTHGFHFSNWWPPGTPDLIINTPIGKVPIGDASNGLCGGFCFAAHDLFQAGRQPPADTAGPPGGSPLVTYLTWRLLASWNIPAGVLTYYYWANTPDHDTMFGARHGVARMTIQDQIPQITSAIDSGQPCTLGLVTVYSADPTQLSKCHQVLAYAYEWNGPYFRVHVYDPNTPNGDSVYLGLDTSNPAHTTPIDSNVNIPESVRGFFFVQYQFQDPSAIAGPPWKVKDKEKEGKEKEGKDHKDKDRKDGKDVMKEKDRDLMAEAAARPGDVAPESLGAWPLAGSDPTGSGKEEAWGATS